LAEVITKIIYNLSDKCDYETYGCDKQVFGLTVLTLFWQLEQWSLLGMHFSGRLYGH